MENYQYKCHYCGKEYIPRRRNKQKFCSNSCRVSAYKLKKKTKPQNALAVPSEEKKQEKITWAGIGNAAIGAGAVEIGKSIFIPTKNKPATKGDIESIKELIQNKNNERYRPIQNMDTNWDGSKPLYDVTTQTVVYLKTNHNYGF